MRWLEPGFRLNQRSHREELMDRPDYWKEREGIHGQGRKILFKEAIR